MSKAIELVGKKYGRLRVISRAPNIGKKVAWNCLCDCGNKKVARSDQLKNGDTSSCGCFLRESVAKRNKKHGLYKTREYTAWVSMLQRCKNKNNKRFNDYGGRGIDVCESWLNFENFYRDMGKAPHGTSINRIDNDGDYCKSNCEWATSKQQQRNKRNNILISMNGETKCLSAWCEELGISYDINRHRINKGLQFIYK